MMDRISTVFLVLWEEEEEQTATRCAVSGEIGNKDQRQVHTPVQTMNKSRQTNLSAALLFVTKDNEKWNVTLNN